MVILLYNQLPNKRFIHKKEKGGKGQELYVCNQKEKK